MIDFTNTSTAGMKEWQIGLCVPLIYRMKWVSIKNKFNVGVNVFVVKLSVIDLFEGVFKGMKTSLKLRGIFWVGMFNIWRHFFVEGFDEFLGKWVKVTYKYQYPDYVNDPITTLSRVETLPFLSKVNHDAIKNLKLCEFA
jgi:hypothetical protein